MRSKIVILLLIMAIVLLTGCIETGKGTSTDTIYGIEYNGIIWKTYSVWLTNDHPSGSGENSYSAIYTVDNDNTDLIEKLQEAKNSGKKVKISYRNEAVILPPWKYNGRAVAIIEDVEYV